MTAKERFFKLCDQHDARSGVPLYVDWHNIRRELEKAVFLHGTWNNSTCVSHQLYCPTPGRQGRDCYKAANAACEAATQKYQRWLDEWRAKQGK